MRARYRVNLLAVGDSLAGYSASRSFRSSSVKLIASAQLIKSSALIWTWTLCLFYCVHAYVSMENVSMVGAYECVCVAALPVKAKFSNIHTLCPYPSSKSPLHHQYSIQSFDDRLPPKLLLQTTHARLTKTIWGPCTQHSRPQLTNLHAFVLKSKKLKSDAHSLNKTDTHTGKHTRAPPRLWTMHKPTQTHIGT